MHDEVDSYQSKLPPFNPMAALQQRIAQKANDASTSPSQAEGSFDPHQMMVDRKKRNAGEVIDNTPVQKWPEKDLKELEDFCKKMGILAINPGRMHPLAVLSKLKDELGIQEESAFHQNKYNPNYPYTETLKKSRILLKG